MFVGGMLEVCSTPKGSQVVIITGIIGMLNIYYPFAAQNLNSFNFSYTEPDG